MTKEQDKSADQEARLKRLERVLEKAEAKLLDQNARLDALGQGREESMRLLGDARAELARVAAERDQLQKEEDEEPGIHSAVPSIEDLMLNLNLSIEETEAQGGRGRLSGQAAEGLDAEWHEMIAPEVMAPEEFGAKANGHDGPQKAARLLVYMDAAHPIKYPLYKDVMTIGRSESADIQIDGEFISRIHARIVCKDGDSIIEDVGSKNGFKINSEPLARGTLNHGDVIAIGKLRFTFVDAKKG
jgi:pSer/pThr/pTyr-binding forkhead associated (FHA) protein